MPHARTQEFLPLLGRIWLKSWTNLDSEKVWREGGRQEITRRAERSHPKRSSGSPRSSCGCHDCVRHAFLTAGHGHPSKRALDRTPLSGRRRRRKTVEVPMARCLTRGLCARSEQTPESGSSEQPPVTTAGHGARCRQPRIVVAEATGRATVRVASFRASNRSRALRIPGQFD